MNIYADKSNKWVNCFLAIIFPIILIILWEYGVNVGIIKKMVLPAPSTLAKTLAANLINHKIQKNLSVSIFRVIKGFVIGTVLGVVFGFLMGLFNAIDKMLTVFVSVLRPIPVIAIVPIIILIFGIGERTSATVIAIGTFWPVLINTIHGVKTVDKKLLELAYSYRISKRKVIFQIVLPAAIPAIVTGIRLGFSSAWMSVVAAEMIASSVGIGYLVMYSRDMAQSDVMYISVLIIGIIGLIIDKALLFAENVYMKKSRGIEQ